MAENERILIDLVDVAQIKGVARSLMIPALAISVSSW
jgi:hypothetical protein